MSLQRIILVLVLLYCCFSVIDFQVGGTLTGSSMLKTRRTQSMRPLTSHTHKTENTGLGKTQTQSRSSISSSASTAPLTEIKAADSEPIPSTSSLSGIQIDSTSLKEVDHRQLSERTRHTSLIESIDLNDPSISTHSDGSINPSRDGVFARVRNTILRYGSAGVIGAAVGVGGFELKKHFFADNNNNNSQENDIGQQQKSSNSSTQLNNIGYHQKTANISTQNVEEITNPLG